jgi:hypothetical protein
MGSSESEQVFLLSKILTWLKEIKENSILYVGIVNLF